MCRVVRKCCMNFADGSLEPSCNELSNAHYQVGRAIYPPETFIFWKVTGLSGNLLTFSSRKKFLSPPKIIFVFRKIFPGAPPPDPLHGSILQCFFFLTFWNRKKIGACGGPLKKLHFYIFSKFPSNKTCNMRLNMHLAPQVRSARI